VKGKALTTPLSRCDQFFPDVHNKVGGLPKEPILSPYKEGNQEQTLKILSHRRRTFITKGTPEEIFCQRTTLSWDSCLSNGRKQINLAEIPRFMGLLRHKINLFSNAGTHDAFYPPQDRDNSPPACW